METRGEAIGSDLELAAFERPLPSGRTLVVRVGADGEELEVRDRGGALELSISLTESGPMVRVRAARIALESPETVSVQCRRFEVETTEGVQLRSEGEVRIEAQEMRVRTASDVHLDGAMIRLNCDQAPASSTPPPPVDPDVPAGLGA